jgi:hypothetical protein
MSRGTCGDSLAWTAAPTGNTNGVPTIVWIAFSLHGALALTLLAIMALVRHRRSGAAGKPPEEDSGDDGGSHPRVPPTTPSSPPDYVEPVWWPEFERELARYQRERATRA